MSEVRSAKDIDKALRKKGFRRELDGKHIHYFFPGASGKKSGVSTLMSHGMGSTTIGDPLLALMARQLHLTKKQFLDLIDCPLDEEQYREILRNAGFGG
jgi:hypothetical protein